VIQRRRRAALVVIVVLANAGMLSHATNAGSGDEPHYLAIAHSLAFDGDLDMANNYGAAEPLIAGGGLDPGLHVYPGKDGTVRPAHDIGLPLLFVPFVRIAAPMVTAAMPRVPTALARRARLTPTIFYRNVIGIGMIALAAILALMTMSLCEWAGASPSAAFWTTALMAVTPPLSVFSFLFFTEIPSALFAVGVVRLVVVRDPSPRAWGVAGVLTGALPLLHSRNMGIVIALVIIAALRAQRTQAQTSAVAYAAAVAALFVVRSAILYHLWGTWLTSKLAHLGAWVSLGHQVQGATLRAAGLLVDQEYGLLVYAPLFVLAAPGIVELWRRNRLACLTVVLVCGCYLSLVLLPLTNPWGWTGGWSPPARFLVPILPFLVVAIATAVPQMRRAVLIPLVTLQIVIGAYAWQHPKMLWNDAVGTASICSRGGLPVCGWLPSLTPFGK
jgi:hypothetical protein